MGLDSRDAMPQNVSLAEAYQAIRKWYSANIDGIESKGGDYAKRSADLIRALPAKLKELEIRAVLGEVIYGNLEWAYHQSDGKYKMAALAHAALKGAGYGINVTEEEKNELKKSSLWPFLSINR